MQRSLLIVLISLCALSMAGADIGLCRGGSSVEVISFLNKHDAPLIYELDADQPWVTLAPDSFILSPGESIDVYEYISPPAKQKSPFSVKLSIREGGRYSEVMQKVVIEDCLNIKVSIEADAFASCPCTPTRYEFTISNTGGFTESYALSLDMDKAYYTIDNSAFSLEPGKSLPVNVFINRPCEVFGEFRYTLNAKALTTGYVVQTPIYHLIDEKCYDYSLAAGNSSYIIDRDEYKTFSMIEGAYIVCIGNVSVIPVTIRNNAHFSNSFNLGVKSPGWAFFKDASITLQPNTSAVAEIVLAPESIQNATVTAYARSARGSITKVLELPVMASGCFMQNIDEPEFAEDEPAAASPVPLWLIILFLVLLLFLLPLLILLFWTKSGKSELKEGRYENKVLGDKSDRTRGGWWKWLVLVLLILLLLSIRPVGDWLRDRNNVSISEPSINITQLNQTQGTGFLENISVQNVSYDFGGPGTNASGNMSVDKAPADEDTTRFWFIFFLVLLLLYLLLRLIMIGKKDEDLKVIDLKRLHRDRLLEKTRRISPILIVIGILVLFLVALIFFLTGLNNTVEPEKPPSILNQTEIKTVFEWHKNEKFALNLSKYTIDVDDEQLTYKVTPTSNITIQVDGEIVAFTPDRDFTGERVINFIAEDSKGGRAYSPDILLSVKEKDTFPAALYSWIKRFFMKSINYVILSAVLIVVVVILLILRVKEARRFKALVIKSKRKL